MLHAETAVSRTRGYMPVLAKIDTWIHDSNLRMFLGTVAVRIGATFDDWDWDAIRFGVQDSSEDQNRRYDYDLQGDPPVQRCGCGARVPHGTDRWAHS